MVNVLVNLKMLTLCGVSFVCLTVRLTVLRLVASTTIGLYAVAASSMTCVCG